MSPPIAKAPVVIAITGMNAKPDNPGPGMAVARCIKESNDLNTKIGEPKIVGLSYDALDPGLYRSDYCNSSYLIPYPSSGEEAVFSRIEHINSIEKIDLLIPCLDSELKTIARIKDRLEAIGIKVLSPDETQIDLRAKDNLPQLAQMAGIKTPAVTRITSTDFFHTCDKEGWKYPLVVKGVFYDAHIVHSPTEAISAFHKISSEWGFPILVQEFIDGGEEVNLSALGDGKGNMIGAVMMKKRAITDKGKAWAGISISDSKLEEAASKLIKASNWSGPLEVEVMQDKQGNYYLIEINPRFPAWIYLSKGVGRNLPESLVKLVIGKESEGNNISFPEYKSGVLFIRYAEELIVELDKFESITMHGFVN